MHDINPPSNVTARMEGRPAFTIVVDRPTPRKISEEIAAVCGISANSYHFDVDGKSLFDPSLFVDIYYKKIEIMVDVTPAKVFDVFYKLDDGRVGAVECTRRTTGDELSKMIDPALKFATSNGQLIYGGETLEDHGITGECMVHPADDIMTVYVKLLFGNVIEVPALPSDTIETFKRHLEQVEGIFTDMTRLVFNGNQLQDDTTMSANNISDKVTLDFVLCLRYCLR